MKYRVRSKEGELEYPSFGAVEQMWLMGLIEPDDEILEEGKTVWRKAGSLPLLAKARRSGEKVWAGTWFIWTLVGVIGGSIALYLLNEPSLEKKVAGALVAVVDVLVMIQITMKAQKKSRPHG